MIKEYVKNIGSLEFVKGRTHEGFVSYARQAAIFTALYSCFTTDGERTSVIYAWAFSICGKMYIGRSRDDFEELLSVLIDTYGLNEKKRIIVYDFFLSYNFHALYRQKCAIKEVFAKDKYYPIKVVMDGFEFRDLDILVGKKLLTERVYTDEIVSRETSLTDEEINKLKSICEKGETYLATQMTVYKNAGRLPLTNTGRARRVFRKLLEDKSYRRIISKLTVEPDEMTLLQNAFEGGLVYCNEDYVGKVLEYVASFDLISSYLASAVAHYYPMSKGKLRYVTNENQLKGYLWVGYVKFNYISSKGVAFISPSRCMEKSHPTYTNGKLESADYVIMPVTSVDFDSIKEYYYYDSVEFGKIYTYTAGKLPKPYIEKLLDLYKEKTELKDKEGKEHEYIVKKCIMNAAAFGLMVADPLRDNARYEKGKWIKEELTLEEKVLNYNMDSGRFSFYLWGIFISAWSRAHLVSCIAEMGKDFVYSDTDSAKILNVENHKDWFDWYNEWISGAIKKTLDEYEIDHYYAEPCNEDGEIKPLGAWEYEGMYSKIKVAGQKKYLGIRDGKLRATVSGASAEGITEYLKQIEDPFGDFDYTLTIPGKYSGRTNYYLIKTEREGHVVDRDGNEVYYQEPFGVFMKESAYNLLLTDIVNFNTTTVSKV
ncbi:MAG: hypothetical protein IIY21_10910 [Clostridiales bacterium]|nr:hypothetical protein [Clostridiales bacterium]MBQ1571182.1 hypothetical protein [Clostridiales bacterium]